MSIQTEINAPHTIIGDPEDFAIGYAFIGDDRTTEISMYSKGKNLLGFVNNGCHLTTRWAYLEELVAWLSDFATTMDEDPYPVSNEGRFAADKDAIARQFESDDLDALDAYFDPIVAWWSKHTWISKRGGAIISNVFFELKGETVEISWDNRYQHGEATFDCDFGCAMVNAEQFRSVVLEFANAYAAHWHIDLKNERTWTRKG